MCREWGRQVLGANEGAVADAGLWLIHIDEILYIY